MHKTTARSPVNSQPQQATVVSASGVAGDDREFLFTDQDFERIRKLIYERAGISLSPIKRDMVYSRVARRLRATGLRSFTAYLSLLEQGDPVEMEAFTNSLTTNLTSFFREEHHFPMLKEHLRPRMKKGAVTIWCSASSTGEEPYSIAMTVAELYGGIPNNVKILASDLDTNVLDKARQGVYPLDRVSKIPEDMLRKYFMRGSGAQDGFVRVRPELQAMLSFRQINLLDTSWPMRGPFDAIFCRNVMIYFDKPTQHGILEKFVPLLTEDGVLFAGHSESFHHAADLFKLRNKTVYELAEPAKKRAHRSEGR
ncbi:MAG: chemotaxis protein CheR [Burkholderiales bacterium]|nr:chemotaxis protein CheR [Burkholderiales bacterium]